MVFQIWDLPGHLDYFDSTFDPEHIFGGCDALIFVIDAQVCLSPQYLTCPGPNSSNGCLSAVGMVG